MKIWNYNVAELGDNKEGSYLKYLQTNAVKDKII